MENLSITAGLRVAYIFTVCLWVNLLKHRQIFYDQDVKALSSVFAPISLIIWSLNWLAKKIVGN